jgi:hypothetical protein
MDRDRELLESAIKKFRFDEATESDERLFSGEGAAAAQSAALNAVRVADDVDEAVNDVILDSLLTKATRDGDRLPESEEPREEVLTFSDELVDRSVRAWRDAASKTLDVVMAAEQAKKDEKPLGGSARKPWQLSLILKGSDVHLVHWACTKTKQGRSCTLDAMADVKWPTPLEYPLLDFTDDLVIHPSIGIRAMKDRVFRSSMPPDMLRLKRVWEKSVSKGEELGSILGICYVCGVGDKHVKPEEDGFNEMTGKVRHCPWCHLDYHEECIDQVCIQIDEGVFDSMCPWIHTPIPEAVRPRRGGPPARVDPCYLCMAWDNDDVDRA